MFKWYRTSAAVFAFALICGAAEPPRFDDYPSPADWSGPVAPIRLTSPSERMFRTRLTEGAKEKPNFAGHYRVTYWGCGSVCGAGAVIDLAKGNVYPLPLGGKGQGRDRWIACSALFDGTGDDFHVNSRLFISRCGWNFDKNGKNWPDVYYFLWEGDRFKELLHIATPNGN